MSGKRLELLINANRDGVERIDIVTHKVLSEFLKCPGREIGFRFQNRKTLKNCRRFIIQREGNHRIIPDTHLHRHGKPAGEERIADFGF